MKDLYDETVDMFGVSMLAGTLDGQTTTLTALRECSIGVLREFANDDDIQHIQITSTCIGFVRGYQKRYARAAQPGGGREGNHGNTR